MAKAAVKEVKKTLTLPMYNLAGEKSDYTLDEKLVASLVKPNFISQVMRVLLSREHKGAAYTKTRGEIRGGGAKPWKQKGTGRARQGSIRSPQWVGGGVVHGPRGAKRELVVPKMWRNKATTELLKKQILEEKVVLVDKFDLAKPNTKLIASFFNKINLGGKKLILVSAKNDNLALSSRNLPTSRLKLIDQLNALDVLRADTLVFEQTAFKEIEKRLVQSYGN